MDLFLVTVTIASLLVAGGMSFVAWRLSRDERERSAARVGALAAEIDDDADNPLPFAWAEAAPAGDSSQTASAPSGFAGGMFATAQNEHQTWARIVPAILAGVLLVGGGVSAVVMLSESSGTAAAAQAQRPLELLSLRHVVSDGSLSVTGLVRNPAGNAAIERLTAVVFLFDDKGGFLASGRAPLDFTSLSASEESPFQITLNAPSGVARYRVSFRRDEGGVLPHVDRRETRMP